MRRAFIVTLSLMMFTAIKAQELKVNLSIAVPNIQNTDPRVFKDMEKQISDYMNNMKWTEDTYSEDEKIETTILITIKEEISQTKFKADIFIQAIRPTYNSFYKTPLITHLDKDVYIEYESFMELQNGSTDFFNNISSLMSFYAYLVLGYDYDSFSPLGGQKYFTVAQHVINLVPQNIIDRDPGWQSVSGSRNRFILIENLLNPRMRPFREGMYNYHRHGLDMMHKNNAEAMEVITTSLNNIGRANRSLPNSMLLQIFAHTKRNEIVEIMKKGEVENRNTVYQIMSKIDPSNISKYRLIRG